MCLDHSYLLYSVALHTMYRLCEGCVLLASQRALDGQRGEESTGAVQGGQEGLGARLSIPKVKVTNRELQINIITGNVCME